ncbi:MAG: tryptophan--tRNA ligase [Proteobacteria bacterium]|nr:tryptophan--tRNA ligase [Pseudomonadota bacterium]
MNSTPQRRRVLSGMRPTGQLHLGNYHGALRNWVALQQSHDAFFFIADWHALTTGYEDTSQLQTHIREMVIDWLAAGIDPAVSTVFVQSQVPEHAELHLLLSMITPLGWLERVPTYKDQQAQLKERDLATYGFLGYPLLQSADILLYRPDYVPVGEDQVAHVEITREIARRFNHLFGSSPDFAKRAEVAVRLLGSDAGVYAKARKRWQQEGDSQAGEQARAVLQQATLGDAERRVLLGYLDGLCASILPEPQVLLTPTPKVPGLDGRKMSKSYGNTIGLREAPDSVAKKLRTMQTDPARQRRTDAGDPAKCPVYDLHGVYSDQATRDWVQQGCRSAGIGCLECKQPLIDRVVAEAEGMQARAKPFQQDAGLVTEVLREGAVRAREAAAQTMDEVRRVMNLQAPA